MADKYLTANVVHSSVDKLDTNGTPTTEICPVNN